MSSNSLPVRAAAGFAALLMASSCAAPPRTPLSPERTAAAFATRSLDDPGLEALAARAGFVAWPPERLDAHALTLVAIRNGEAVRLARAKWRTAEAAVRAAGERPNPSLALSPLRVTNAEPGVSPWMIAASLVELIDPAGKRPLRVEKARFAAEAARFELFAAGREAAERIDALLLELAGAEARSGALEAQVAAEGELVEAAETRLKVGVGSSLELAAVRAAEHKAVLDRQAALAELTDALNRLAVTVGLPAGQLPLERLQLPRLDRTLPEGFIDRVRAAAPLNRADLLARLADYGAADAELRLQLAGRMPDIEAGPGFEYDKGDREWGIALNTTLPLFNRNGGAIGQAAALRRQAQTQFETAQAGVIGEVERAAKAYGQALQGLAVAERLYADQVQRARGQEALFARGEIDRVEALAARAELAAQLAARAGAQVAVARAALAVEAAGQLNVDGFDPVTLISPEADR